MFTTVYNGCQRWSCVTLVILAFLSIRFLSLLCCRLWFSLSAHPSVLLTVLFDVSLVFFGSFKILKRLLLNTMVAVANFFHALCFIECCSKYWVPKNMTGNNWRRDGSFVVIWIVFRWRTRSALAKTIDGPTSCTYSDLEFHSFTYLYGNAVESTGSLSAWQYRNRYVNNRSEDRRRITNGISREELRR